MATFRFLRQMIFDGRGHPPAPRHQPDPATWTADAITGSCLGHSTVLLNVLGIWILTDPVFSLRVGPGVAPFILGPKRYLQPALPPAELPTPDLILLSHAHFDHCDAGSLRQFSRDVPVITAAHTSDLWSLRRFRAIRELSWGDAHTLSVPNRGMVRVTAVEVAHWGARWMRDTHRGYGGYLVERGGHSLLFAGDTAYTPAFARLRPARAPLDLALMPVGAYNPWIQAHCTPEQAIAMADQAGPFTSFRSTTRLFA